MGSNLIPRTIAGNAHTECKEEAESGRFNERDLVGPNFQ
jgi:hypothetical protein